MNHELDPVAQQLFNANYGQLSEFAKDSVRRVASQYQGALNPNINTEVSITRKLAEVEQQNAMLRRENEDLWEENEQLKMDLYDAEGRDENSSSGSA